MFVGCCLRFVDCCVGACCVVVLVVVGCCLLRAVRGCLLFGCVWFVV